MLGLFRLIFGGGLAPVTDLVKAVAGDKAAKESNVHDEQRAVLEGYQAEYMGSRPGRTWWDSLVDGLNRLVRPAMTGGAIWLVFVWPIMDITSFAAAMAAYAAVPQELWYLLLTIVAFWFGGRILERAPGKVTVDAGAIAAAQAAAKSVQGERVDEEAYRAELSGKSGPMSNWAILEWNRRRSAAAG